MNYQEILEKLRNCHIKNNKDEIDIIYYLQIYVNIECVIDQLLNIYYYNKHLNFRVVIWINKNDCSLTGDTGKTFSKECLEKLNLPDWVVIYKMGYLVRLGVDFIRSGFMRTYKEYIKNLNFKYISRINQNLLFINKVELSLIKEVNKNDIKFGSFHNKKNLHWVGNNSSPIMVNFFNKNKIKIINTSSCGNVFTKKNIDKIIDYIDNNIFNNNIILKEFITKSIALETFLLKTIEYHICNTYVTTNITKRYLPHTIFTYPIIDDLKKDIEKKYEEEATLYFDNLDKRGENPSIKAFKDVKRKNLTEKDINKICGGETLNFSFTRVRLNLNDKVRKFIRNNIFLNE